MIKLTPLIKNTLTEIVSGRSNTIMLNLKHKLGIPEPEEDLLNFIERKNRQENKSTMLTAPRKENKPFEIYATIGLSPEEFKYYKTIPIKEIKDSIYKFFKKYYGQAIEEVSEARLHDSLSRLSFRMNVYAKNINDHWTVPPELRLDEIRSGRPLSINLKDRFGIPKPEEDLHNFIERSGRWINGSLNVEYPKREDQPFKIWASMKLSPEEYKLYSEIPPDILEDSIYKFFKKYYGKAIEKVYNIRFDEVDEKLMFYMDVYGKNEGTHWTIPPKLGLDEVRTSKPFKKVLKKTYTLKEVIELIGIDIDSTVKSILTGTNVNNIYRMISDYDTSATDIINIMEYPPVQKIIKDAALILTEGTEDYDLIRQTSPEKLTQQVFKGEHKGLLQLTSIVKLAFALQSYKNDEEYLAEELESMKGESAKSAFTDASIEIRNVQVEYPLINSRITFLVTENWVSDPDYAVSAYMVSDFRFLIDFELSGELVDVEDFYEELKNLIEKKIF